MRNSEFWLAAQTASDRGAPKMRIGLMRVTLLFGSIAVAMALFLPPMVADSVPRSFAYSAGVDQMTTGSIMSAQGVGSRQYTIRRSILQEPGSFCIVDGQGRAINNC